jgi:uncharacterized protein YebE (UPF0316 family)
MVMILEDIDMKTAMTNVKRIAGTVAFGVALVVILRVSFSLAAPGYNVINSQDKEYTVVSAK